MKVWMIAILALGWSIGCDPAGSNDSLDFWSVPDLNGMGKADGSAPNIQWGGPLVEGGTQYGYNEGFVALPVELTEDEPFLVQAWTDEPSAVFVFGPNTTGKWDMEQLRQKSKTVEPGVETQIFQIEPTETGSYLVVLGAKEGRATQWIVAWGDRGDEK